MSYKFLSFLALFNSSKIGFANASPTITMLVAFVDLTCLRSNFGSRPSLGKVIIQPPRTCVVNPPRNIPVPCIKGHAIKHLIILLFLFMS